MEKSQNGLIISMSALIGTLLIGSLFYLYFNTDKKQQDEKIIVNVNSASTTINKTFATTTESVQSTFGLGDISPTPLDSRWKKNEALDYLSKQAVIYQNTAKFGYIPFDGNEWTIDLKSLSEKELKENGPWLYSGERMESNGWVKSVDFGGYNFQPISGGRSYSNLDGYIKLSGNKFRTIVFHEELEGVQISLDNEPMQFGPPYHYLMSVFVSEEKDISDILRIISEQKSDF